MGAEAIGCILLVLFIFILFLGAKRIPDDLKPSEEELKKKQEETEERKKSTIEIYKKSIEEEIVSLNGIFKKYSVQDLMIVADKAKSLMKSILEKEIPNFEKKEMVTQVAKKYRYPIAIYAFFNLKEAIDPEEKSFSMDEILETISNNLAEIVKLTQECLQNPAEENFYVVGKFLCDRVLYG